MTDHNTTRSNRRSKRKAAAKVEAPEFEVLEVEATPIVVLPVQNQLLQS